MWGIILELEKGRLNFAIGIKAENKGMREMNFIIKKKN